MMEQAWNYKSVVAKDSNNTGASSGNDSGESGGSNQIEYYNVNMKPIMDEQDFYIVNGVFLEYSDRAVVNYDGTPILVGGGEATRMWLQDEIDDEDILRASFSKEPIYVFSEGSWKAIDEGSWKANYKKYIEVEERDEHSIEVYLNRFTPITKEQFYSLE